MVDPEVWNERRKSLIRYSHREKAEQRIAAGLCPQCGLRPTGTVRRLCDECRARHAETKLSRKSGTRVRKSKLTDAEALDLHRARARRVSRMQIRLDHVLQFYQAMPPAEFRRWLMHEVARREKERVDP